MILRGSEVLQEQEAPSGIATVGITRGYPARALDDVQNLSFVSFLDLSRWLAASIVFLGHLRNPLFLGYSSVPAADQNPIIGLWYFVTGWHAAAVIVFFVLSGYLVGGLSSARASVGQFNSVDYMIDRVTRLYPAFIGSLVLTAVLDNAGVTWFSVTGFYNHTHPMIQEKVATAPFVVGMTWQIFLSNALMLQHLFFSPFGSNQPLWTISIEFWFYVVFGMGLAASLAKTAGVRFLGYAAVVSMVAVLGAGFLQLMGLWLIGLGAACVPRRLVQRPLLALLVFVGVLVLARSQVESVKHDSMVRTARDYLTALSFAWLLVSMRSVTFAPLEKLVRFNRFMADFSYSLYLIHFPLMLFVLGAFHATGRFEGIAHGYSPSDPVGLFVYGATIVLVYLVAWGFSLVTERQTGTFRRLIHRKLGKATVA